MGAIVINEKSLIGPGPVRNAGAKIAKGSILAFTDADTIVPRNWLKIIDRAFKKNPNFVGLVGTWHFKRTTKLLKFLHRLVFTPANLAHKLITGSYAFHGTNFAIKKTAFFKAGGFDPTYHSLEDVELANRVNRIGKIVYLPELKVATTDRRFRNRLKAFLADFAPIYFSVAILKKPHSRYYPNIRK